MKTVAWAEIMNFRKNRNRCHTMMIVTELAHTPKRWANSISYKPQNVIADNSLESEVRVM